MKEHTNFLLVLFILVKILYSHWKLVTTFWKWGFNWFKKLSSSLTERGKETKIISVLQLKKLRSSWINYFFDKSNMKNCYHNNRSSSSSIVSFLRKFHGIWNISAKSWKFKLANLQITNIVLRLLNYFSDNCCNENQHLKRKKIFYVFNKNVIRFLIYSVITEEICSIFCTLIIVIPTNTRIPVKNMKTKKNYIIKTMGLIVN